MLYIAFELKPKKMTRAEYQLAALEREQRKIVNKAILNQELKFPKQYYSLQGKIEKVKTIVIHEKNQAWLGR